MIFPKECYQLNFTLSRIWLTEPKQKWGDKFLKAFANYRFSHIGLALKWLKGYPSKIWLTEPKQKWADKFCQGIVKLPFTNRPSTKVAFSRNVGFLDVTLKTKELDQKYSVLEFFSTVVSSSHKDMNSNILTIKEHEQIFQGTVV